MKIPMCQWVSRFAIT